MPMRINVDLDRLMKQNQGDPKKTAANLQTMQQAGINLNLQVRSLEATQVFAHLSVRQPPPWRTLLAWLLKPQGMVAGFGVLAYGTMAVLML